MLTAPQGAPQPAPAHNRTRVPRCGAIPIPALARCLTTVEPAIRARSSSLSGSSSSASMTDDGCPMDSRNLSVCSRRGAVYLLWQPKCWPNMLRVFRLNVAIYLILIASLNVAKICSIFPHLLTLRRPRGARARRERSGCFTCGWYVVCGR